MKTNNFLIKSKRFIKLDPISIIINKTLRDLRYSIDETLIKNRLNFMWCNLMAQSRLRLRSSDLKKQNSIISRHWILIFQMLFFKLGLSNDKYKRLFYHSNLKSTRIFLTCTLKVALYSEIHSRFGYYIM